jgi:ankyrin repeat protein
MSKTALIESVKQLAIENTKRILAERPDLLHVTDRQGRNLLHIASAASTQRLGKSKATQVRLVSYLLDQGFEIDLTFGKDDVTALFAAVARARNPLLVKLFLERGADVNKAPGGGLFAAAWWDDVENMKLLIAAGARIDIVVGITPFLAAWLWKKFRTAKVLAASGANVNFQDRKGKTALHHSVEKEYDVSQIKWLVRHGASPDIEDNEGVSAALRASRKRDKRFHAALTSR